MATYKQQFKYKSNDFINKVYLITGANRGLGRSLAIDLSKAGATVVMLGRDLASLENVYDEITDLGYSEPFLYPFDLEGAGPKDYEDLLTNIESEFGQLDGLIHNAATIGSLMPIEQYDLKVWFSTMQINLNAPFLLTQFLLPALKKSPAAQIIFLSSYVGRFPRAYWGAYSVTKSGIESLSSILAEELEKTEIKVNSIDPMRMKTKMRQIAYPAENADKNPDPSDVSKVILFVLSSEACHDSGDQLKIDVLLD